MPRDNDECPITEVTLSNIIYHAPSTTFYWRNRIAFRIRQFQKCWRREMSPVWVGCLIDSGYHSITVIDGHSYTMSRQKVSFILCRSRRDSLAVLYFSRQRNCLLRPLHTNWDLVALSHDLITQGDSYLHFRQTIRNLGIFYRYYISI